MSEGSMEFNMNIPQPKTGDKAPLSLGTFVPPTLESQQDAVNPKNPESKFSFDTTVPNVTPEIKSETQNENFEEKEKSKETLEEELQMMIEKDLQQEMLANKEAAKDMKISVDTLAVIARSMFIMGKMMMLLILNKNGDFKFSGKDLGLSDRPPEGKLNEDNEKLGVNPNKSWADAVERIEKIKNVEFAELLIEALSVVNANVPMKIKKEKSNTKTLKNAMNAVTKTYFPKGSVKSR